MRPPRPASTAQDREEFQEGVAAASRRLDTTRPAAPPDPSAPSPAAVLRALRTGKREVRDDCQVSVRHLTRDEARSKLERFLREQRRKRRRFVLVIHGKGLGAPEGLPVLAPLVPEWLAGWKPELVAGWGLAHQKDGGSGALYVVLTTARS